MGSECMATAWNLLDTQLALAVSLSESDSAKGQQSLSHSLLSFLWGIGMDTDQATPLASDEFVDFTGFSQQH